jgi:DHA1 family bicyclomycin/chloramphenicol resistance-like MFS transporter
LTRPALSERALITLLAAATAAGPVAVNIYLPVLPAVRAEFGVSVAAANVTVSAPLVAFAIGLLIWGPLSDRHGRRPVLLLGLGINVVGSIVALFAHSLGWLMLGRIVQALGSAGGVTVARATIGDLFGRERMARMIAYLTMVMLMANSIAPAAGGALAEFAGWRAVFVLLCIVSTLVWLASLRFMPETRAHEHRHNNRELLEAMKNLIATPAFVGLALISGLIYAEFFVFVSLMPYVFGEALGHSSGEYGLWYLWIAVGYFAGNWCVTRFAVRFGVHRLLAGGVAVSAGAALIGLGIALAGLWQGLAVFAPWLVIAFGQGLALPSLTASAVTLAPRSAGIANGLLGFVQQFGGALGVQAMAFASVATPVPVAAFTAASACAALLAFGLGGAAFRATSRLKPG